MSEEIRDNEDKRMFRELQLSKSGVTLWLEGRIKEMEAQSSGRARKRDERPALRELQRLSGSVFHRGALISAGVGDAQKRVNDGDVSSEIFCPPPPHPLPRVDGYHLASRGDGATSASKNNFCFFLRPIDLRLKEKLLLYATTVAWFPSDPIKRFECALVDVDVANTTAAASELRSLSIDKKADDARREFVARNAAVDGRAKIRSSAE
jgi:hypothetical protein